MEDNANINAPAEETQAEQAEFDKAFFGEIGYGPSENGEEATAEETREEPEEEESEETEASGEEAEDEDVEEAEEEAEEPQKIAVGGKEYTQEEIAGILAERERTPWQMEWVNQLAEEAGVTPEELREHTERQKDEQKVAERVAGLVDQGVEEDLAEHIARTEVENARLKAKDDRTEQQRLQAEGDRDARAKEIHLLWELYPETKEMQGASVPPEFDKDYAETGRPVEAWQRHLLREQGKRLAETEKKLAQLEQNEKNRETSTGGAKGAAAETGDVFMDTFLKTFKGG